LLELRETTLPVFGGNARASARKVEKLGLYLDAHGHHENSMARRTPFGGAAVLRAAVSPVSRFRVPDLRVVTCVAYSF
jgi:hypothetical protein